MKKEQEQNKKRHGRRRTKEEEGVQNRAIRERDETMLLFTTVECDVARIETTVGEWGCGVSN